MLNSWKVPRCCYLHVKRTPSHWCCKTHILASHTGPRNTCLVLAFLNLAGCKTLLVRFGELPQASTSAPKPAPTVALWEFYPRLTCRFYPSSCSYCYVVARRSISGFIFRHKTEGPNFFFKLRKPFRHSLAPMSPRIPISPCL